MILRMFTHINITIWKQYSVVIWIAFIKCYLFYYIMFKRYQFSRNNLWIFPFPLKLKFIIRILADKSSLSMSNSHLKLSLKILFSIKKPKVSIFIRQPFIKISFIILWQRQKIDTNSWCFIINKISKIVFLTIVMLPLW